MIRILLIQLCFYFCCFVVKPVLGTIFIKPVILEFSASQSSEEIVLENQGDKEKIFHVSIKEWHYEGNEFSYQDTNRVVIFPATAKIPPNGSQKFRVVVKRHPEAGRQEPYRIIFKEVPRPNKDVIEGVHFSFLYNILVPVFVMGHDYKAKVDVSWSAHNDKEKKLTTIAVDNTGTTFVKLRGLSSPKAPDLKQNDWVYLLPNQRRIWAVKTPKGIHEGIAITYHISFGYDEEDRTVTITPASNADTDIELLPDPETTVALSDTQPPTPGANTSTAFLPLPSAHIELPQKSIDIVQGHSPEILRNHLPCGISPIHGDI